MCPLVSQSRYSPDPKARHGCQEKGNPLQRHISCGQTQSSQQDAGRVDPATHQECKGDLTPGNQLENTFLVFVPIPGTWLLKFWASLGSIFWGLTRWREDGSPQALGWRMAARETRCD